jgi:hypothetical protein
MERELADNLIEVARAYGVARGLMESTVARKFAGDGRFFVNIRSGLSFTARKYDAVMNRFSDNWPQEVDWPEGVARPLVNEPPSTPAGPSPAPRESSFEPPSQAGPASPAPPPVREPAE